MFIPRPPPTRGDCVDGPRPCAALYCRHHLWLHASEDMPGRRGEDRALPDPKAWARRESCALDVADRVDHGDLTLDEIGEYLGVTRERVRQMELSAGRKLRRQRALLGSG